MPTLLVIAGCNGAGKSSFSRNLSLGLDPYDDDLVFKQFYDSIMEFDHREVMARNMTEKHRETLFTSAIRTGTSFCYETNFSDSPMHWPDRFAEAGFALRMMFLCLSDAKQAKERVSIRVANGGHAVSDEEVVRRFKAGYSHLDRCFNRFSHIDLFDSSGYNVPPKPFLSLSDGKVVFQNRPPDFLAHRLPNITSLF